MSQRDDPCQGPKPWSAVNNHSLMCVSSHHRHPDDNSAHGSCATGQSCSPNQGGGGWETAYLRPAWGLSR